MGMIDRLTKDYTTVTKHDLQKISEKMGEAFADAVFTTHEYFRTKYVDDSVRTTALNCTTNLLVASHVESDRDSLATAVAKCLRLKVPTLSEEKANKISEEVVEEYIERLEKVALENAKRGPIARMIARFGRNFKGFIRYLFSFEVFAAALTIALYKTVRYVTAKKMYSLLEGMFTDTLKLGTGGIEKLIKSLGGQNSAGAVSVFFKSFIGLFFYIIFMKSIGSFFKGIGKIFSTIPHIVTYIWSLPLKIVRKVVTYIYYKIRGIGARPSEEEKLIEMKLRMIDRLVMEYYYTM